MITKEQVYAVGQVAKTHGVRGELSIAFSTLMENGDNLDFLILETEGVLVPFFIESWRGQNAKNGLIHFEGIDTEAAARALIGSRVFVPVEKINPDAEGELDPDFLIGYQIIDKLLGEVGVVVEIDDETDNILFVVHRDDQEYLIPASDDFIDDINHDDKTIHMTLPEGLLDL